MQIKVTSILDILIPDFSIKFFARKLNSLFKAELSSPNSKFCTSNILNLSNRLFYVELKNLVKAFSNGFS